MDHLQLVLDNKIIVIAFVVGLVLGYGIRAIISKRRHAREREVGHGRRAGPVEPLVFLGGRSAPSAVPKTTNGSSENNSPPKQVTVGKSRKRRTESTRSRQSPDGRERGIGAVEIAKPLAGVARRVCL